jgi:hypothetical protein
VEEKETMGLLVSNPALGMDLYSSKGSTKMSHVAVCKVLRHYHGSLLPNPTGWASWCS